MSLSLRRFVASNRRLVLVVVAVLALNLALRVLVLIPLRVSSQNLREQLARGDQQLAEAVAGWDRTSRETVLLEQARERVRSLYTDELQTRQQRYPEVDREIKRLAANQKLSATSITYTSEREGGRPVERYAASFPLKGGYPNLRQFIAQIEQSEQFFIIERINLSDSSERGTELNLTIQLVTYFWDPIEERKGDA